MVFNAKFNGKFWKIAAKCGSPEHRWAWLVNINNPKEQVRLSLKSPHFV